MIKICKINNDLLNEIIEEIGSLSIKHVEIYIVDDEILYDVLFDPEKVIIVFTNRTLKIIRRTSSDMINIDSLRFTEAIIV